MRKHLEAKMLGMPVATARYKLIRSLLFQFATECGKGVCFRCNKDIKHPDEFSLDHVVDWRYSDDAGALFFDLENVKLSHHKCNRDHPKRGSHKVKSNCGYKGVCFSSENRKKQFRAFLYAENKS